MRTRTCTGWVFGALAVAGCAPVEAEDVAMHSHGAGGGEAQIGPRDAAEPSPATLCQIELGTSSQQEIEDLLGRASVRATASHVTLLYQYTSGLTLSLRLVEGVFEDATVYNGDYPECWVEQEERREAEAAALARERLGLDAGL